MLTRIDVDSENSFYVPILGVTPKDSLLVRHVSGLNPPEIDLFIGDYARDGGTYQGRRIGNRNVVITFDLNPNHALGETVSGLREMLYKAFVDPHVEADFIKLNLHDDSGRVRYLVGYTEKFETEIFDVETMAQISIICPDPYLRDIQETILEDPSGWTAVPFTYTGTAETGFVAQIYVTSTTPKITLENNGKTMEITRSFSAGDMVEINTSRGERSVTYTPVGEDPLPILGDLSVLSPWLELHSQANTMKVYGSTPSDLPAAIRSLRFRQSYWGI